MPRWLTDDELRKILEWAEHNDDRNQLAAAYMSACGTVYLTEQFDPDGKSGCTEFARFLSDNLPRAGKWSKISSANSKAYKLRDYIGELILQSVFT